MAVLTAITGGSGSGKSTVALAIKEALKPGSAVILSEDWYYHDWSAFPGFDAATFDFDDISVRDHALLRDHLAELKAGRPVMAPDYCFVRHARREVGLEVQPAPVVIVEGSHLLCPPELSALFELKVYLETPSDVRFIRRLLRDQAERGRSQESIVHQYLRTVRPAHLRFTEASRPRADLVLEDAGAGVQDPDPADVGALIAPVLAHPLLRPFRA